MVAWRPRSRPVPALLLALVGDGPKENLCNLSYSSAIVARGLCDELFGTLPLPASMSIPGDPALVGLPFFQQAYVPDPGSNRFGGVLSGSVRGVVGGR